MVNVILAQLNVQTVKEELLLVMLLNFAILISFQEEAPVPVQLNQLLLIN